MARKPHNSELIRIERHEFTLKNSINNQEILSLVGAKGYSQEKLHEGLGLVDEAREKVGAKPAALGSQKDATSATIRAGKLAMESYQDLANIAKANFRDKPQKLAMLGLDKPMPRNTEELAERGLALVGNIAKDDEIKTAMADHGYPAEALMAERAKFEECKRLEAEQKSAKGQKEVTTDESQAAMEALDDWMMEYKRIAKVALRKRKNLMEKIGIKVRTTKTVAQRAAPKKAAATKAAKKAAK